MRNRSRGSPRAVRLNRSRSRPASGSAGSVSATAAPSAEPLSRRASRPGRTAGPLSKQEGPPRWGRPFHCLKSRALRRPPRRTGRRAPSGSGGGSAGRSDDPGLRGEPRPRTMRHWITSFRLLTTRPMWAARAPSARACLHMGFLPYAASLAAWATRRFTKRAQASSWAASMNSSGLWASPIDPGPITTVGMPASENSPASVP